MVRHVVLWRLKDKSKILEMKGKLETLPALVPGIKYFQVGKNGPESDTASDLALVSDFEDWDALQHYNEHPEHQKVVAFVRSISSERRAVDFEYH
jgi:hypothetical protein